MSGSRVGSGIKGEAHVFFAFDLGFQVDLDRAAVLASRASRPRVLRRRRHAPAWFDLSPPPLRFEVDGDAVAVGDFATESTVEILVHDFGAALLSYRVRLPATVEELPGLAAALYDHEGLEADARARAAAIGETIREAIERPALSETVEDYVVYVFESWEGEPGPAAWFAQHEALLARVIEAEEGELAAEQVARVTAGRFAYSPRDLAVIDWNAAVLLDPEPDDVLALLQHANVELLELRVLDEELDAMLERADETLAGVARSRIWPGVSVGRTLVRFATMQVDAAVLFESVDNAIKHLGNQYLARLYRLAAERLDLPSWHQSVQRKLEVSESVYGKMSDGAATRRLETLEWVIVILILVSIILPFTPWGY